jgi:hypothetical protein
VLVAPAFVLALVQTPLSERPYLLLVFGGGRTHSVNLGDLRSADTALGRQRQWQRVEHEVQLP